jgi:hypothetical protein
MMEGRKVLEEKYNLKQEQIFTKQRIATLE